MKHAIKVLILLSLFIINCQESQLNPDPLPDVIDREYPIVTCSIPIVPNVTHKLCPDDMVYIEKLNFCMDRFEFPNQKGVLPIDGINYETAVNMCKSVNKRLCTEQEWEYACTNGITTPFPYGQFYNRGTCNDDKSNYIVVPWEKMNTPEWPAIVKRLNKDKLEVSGNRPLCKTNDGAFDIIGNAAEIVENKNRPYGFAVKGGFFYGAFGNSSPTCGFSNFSHAKGFSSYEFGTRCCVASK